MDRLNASARLMIVSDLDCTMVDHDDPENLSLLRFNALWEANYRHDSLLVFSTGRSPTHYQKLRNKKPLLTPDITIMSVGTEIAYGESMLTDIIWEQRLNYKWNRDVVIEETKEFSDLIPQSETKQQPHKVSFYLEKRNASEVIYALSKRLENRGLDVKVIYSNGTALDILPQGAGKGCALAYLLEKFSADGKGPVSTLVCGDSGNDAELYTIPGVYGVMVSNSQEELLDWYKAKGKDNEHIIHATERCAAGIMQAIGKFSLGPTVSPRDIRDNEKCNIGIINPSLEVINFYLHYERWLHGEVENSELHLQEMKSKFSSVSNIVQPSGVDRPMYQIIDALANLHGDKKGTQFQVWLDKVYFSQIGQGTWQVKFDKWELSGVEKRGCLTKVLMSSKAGAPELFTWMHIHQTWLDDSVYVGNTTWLF